MDGCSFACPRLLPQQDAAQASGEEERGLDLRLTTFNLLAPCYKRIPSEVPGLPAGTGLLASQAKTLHTARESEFAGLWRERALETVGWRVESGRGGCPWRWHRVILEDSRCSVLFGCKVGVQVGLPATPLVFIVVTYYMHGCVPVVLQVQQEDHDTPNNAKRIVLYLFL